MKLSIPGLPGVSYDTEADAAPLTAVFTAAGRRAPKPHGYALQALPVLWALDVDLQAVPDDHPLQYLHPEGARSLEELPDHRVAGVGRDLDFSLRFLAAVNDRTEESLKGLLGREETFEGTVIEIDDADGGNDGPDRTDSKADAVDERPASRRVDPDATVSSGTDRAESADGDPIDAGHADEPTFAEDGTDPAADEHESTEDEADDDDVADAGGDGSADADRSR